MKLRIEYLPFLVALLISAIPFLWLKPGQIDIGGDSSRLYFYDPMQYLRSFPLYAIGPTGTGSNLASYFLIPYTTTLYIVKQIVGSTHYLIVIFDCINLVTAFLSVFFIIISLLKIDFKEQKYKTNIYIGALIASLFYTFSPVLTPNGWDKAMYAHNQYFLNPLFFFLLLRFVQTKKIYYLLIGLIVSFIFAPNFTATPFFFSFFPLAFLYCVIYSYIIRRNGLPIKSLLIAFALFILIHAFHIIPQILNLLTPSNYLNTGAFSNQGKLIRGQSYFLEVAKSTKLSNSLLSIVQGDKNPLSFLWVAFPILIAIGAIYNKQIIRIKKKAGTNYLLLFVIFLILTFFVTANITLVGFLFYKNLFNIPGFAMFRNYVGQFGHVYIFYYSLLIGYAVFYVLSIKIKVWKFYKIPLVLLLTLLILVTAVPFIRGDMINLVINPGGSPKLSVPIIMDPSYESALAYVRSIPIDAKTITFPITDAGVQVITGKGGGAYQGPSMISYLTEKEDFLGYDGIYPFSDVFLSTIESNDYDALEKLFSILNIGYVFYNSDELVYGKAFPNFPYSYTQAFIPTERKAYDHLLANLPLDNKKVFSEKYAVYPVQKSNFLPHIYTPDKVINSDESSNLLEVLKLEKVARPIVINQKDTPVLSQVSYIEAKPDAPYGDLRNNYHLHTHSPFASQAPGSPLYPIILYKEKYDLEKQKPVPDAYIDLGMYHAAKRIEELGRWREEVKITHRPYSARKLIDLINPNSYNSWEAELYYYASAMQSLINYTHEAKQSNTWEDIKELLIYEQLTQHEVRLYNTARELNISDADKSYLNKLISNHFSELFSDLTINPMDPSNLIYNLPSVSEKGEYIILIKSNKNTDGSSPEVLLDNKSSIPFRGYDRGYLSYGPVALEAGSSHVVRLLSKKENLADSSTPQWDNSGYVTSDNGTEQVLLKNVVNSDTGGLTRQIAKWEPGKQYLISFDYDTDGKPVEYALFERQKINGKVTSSRKFRKYLKASTWRTQQSLITAGKNVDAAFLEFANPLLSSEQKFSLRNFSVVEVTTPKMFFVKQDPKVAYKNPQITFSKKNPTKYVVSVKGAKGPFILALNESFDSQWSLYADQSSPSTWTDKVHSALGKFLSAVTSSFQDTIQSNKKVASHFTSEIIETEHNKVFLDPSTFESWGKPKIDEKSHFITNTYANGWLITPEILGGKSEGKIIIEFETQRRFYILFLVSIISVGITIIYLVYAFINKK